MFDVIHLSVADTDNILNDALNVDAASTCNSAIFAGICYKLAGFYAELADNSYQDALNNPRVSKDRRNDMYDLFSDTLDCVYTWGRKFHELLDGDVEYMTRAERQQRRRNALLFQDLLFRHWDEENCVWQFNGVTFG